MWFFGFIFLTYLLVLSFLLFSLLTIKSKPVSTENPIKQFSIIVAFRNEEQNLPVLINSFKSIQYPKDNYEIIFVNDHSTDASVSVIQQFEDASNHIKLLQLTNENNGKKAALQLGITQAKFEYIITTDADCIVPEKWLFSFNHKLVEDNPDVLIGSVGIVQKPDFLSRFQYYDLMALQAVGFALANINKPILCNGANFCYKKEAFINVNGFQGNQKQPSGDDVLLLQKFVKAKLNIGFLIHHNHTVFTASVANRLAFIQQRKRWFYKSKESSSLLQKALGVLLLVINFSVLGLFIFAFFNTTYFIDLTVLLIVKFTIDFFLTFELAKKLKLPFCFTNFALANLFYPIGIAIFFSYLTNSKIKWKQREYHS